MSKIIAALVLLIIGVIMVVWTKSMIRFQIWTQHTLMGAQYVPSQRTYTAVRVIGAFLVVLGILVGLGILK